ncbi:MAG: ABC transporter permease [Candidatus Baltobacteraceae bacterium]
MAVSAPLDVAAPDDAFVLSKNTVWKRFRKHRLAMIGAVVLLCLVLAAVFAPWIAGQDPNAIDQVHWQGNSLPPCFQDAHLCGGHRLGTDETGRDLFARLVFGARISLTVGVAAVVMELIIGTFLGAMAGYFRSVPFTYTSRVPHWANILNFIIGFAGVFLVAYLWPNLGNAMPHLPKPFGGIENDIGPLILAIVVGWALSALVRRLPVGEERVVRTALPVDWLIMRITDVFLSIPLLPLMLTLTGIVAAMSTKASLDFKVIVVIIGGLSWPGVARLVRATYLSLREREYTEAARAVGNRDGRIIFRHLLPNAMAPLTVQATLDVANVIVLESALSFLGFGIQPPTASWGNMLANAESNLETAWWAAVFPGLCILITVLAINYIGDGLRDALDPNMR